MKRLLQLGFVVGLIGTLLAAYFAPWFQYERFPSATRVLVNGGRVEQFLVQLPVDRIGAPISARGTGEAAGAAPVQLDHFKLRDTDGNVIGIAARHVVSRDNGDETSWLLTIPSRGTVALAGHMPRGSTIDAALAERGLSPGQSIEPALSIDLGGTAESVTATGEFADIDFQLVETWVVSGIDSDGQVRGVLHLNTVGMQSS